MASEIDLLPFLRFVLYLAQFLKIKNFAYLQSRSKGMQRRQRYPNGTGRPPNSVVQRQFQSYRPGQHRRIMLEAMLYPHIFERFGDQNGQPMDEQRMREIFEILNLQHLFDQLQERFQRDQELTQEQTKTFTSCHDIMYILDQVVPRAPQRTANIEFLILVVVFFCWRFGINRGGCEFLVNDETIRHIKKMCQGLQIKSEDELKRRENALDMIKVITLSLIVEMCERLQIDIEMAA